MQAILNVNGASFARIKHISISGRYGEPLHALVCLDNILRPKPVADWVGDCIGKSAAIEFTDKERKFEIPLFVTGIEYSASAVRFTLTNHTGRLSRVVRSRVFCDCTLKSVINKILGESPVTSYKVELDDSLEIETICQIEQTDADFLYQLANRFRFCIYETQGCITVAEIISGDEALFTHENVIDGDLTLSVGAVSPGFEGFAQKYHPVEQFVAKSGLSSSMTSGFLEEEAYGASKVLYGNSPNKFVTLQAESRKDLEKQLDSEQGCDYSKSISYRFRTHSPDAILGQLVRFEELSVDCASSVITEMDGSWIPTGEYTANVVATNASYATSVINPLRAKMGVTTATVVDNHDVDGLGRVFITFPWDESQQKVLVRVASTATGKEIGTLWVPSIGCEVLVAFQNNDPSSPIVIGSLYNSDNMPPGNSADNPQDVWLARTRGHSSLGIREIEGAEEIQILSGDPNSNDCVGIVVRNNEIEITCSMGNLYVTADTLKVKSKSISLDASESVQIAGSSVQIKSQDIKLTE